MSEARKVLDEARALRRRSAAARSLVPLPQRGVTVRIEAATFAGRFRRSRTLGHDETLALREALAVIAARDSDQAAALEARVRVVP